MNTTYKKLIQFRTAASAYIEEVENKSIIAETIDDIITETNDLMADCDKRRNRLRRKFATKDPKTSVLLRVDGELQFTEDGENDLEDAFEELLNEEVHTLAVVLSNEITESIPRKFKNAFKGFIIA